jgi:glutathione peroxidase
VSHNETGGEYFVVFKVFIFGIMLMAQPLNFYDLAAKSISGKPFGLGQFKGQVVLVVNVASRCGYTSQYKGLEALYQKYKQKNFVVLGFPANDFGAQEPGSDTEIKKFCELNYGVTFPLMSKNPVTGSEKQPVYKWLLQNYKGQPSGEVAWNFEKFLVDKNGQVVARYKSAVKPEDPELMAKIESLLAAQ